MGRQCAGLLRVSSYTDRVMNKYIIIAGLFFYMWAFSSWSWGGNWEVNALSNKQLILLTVFFNWAGIISILEKITILYDAKFSQLFNSIEIIDKRLERVEKRLDKIPFKITDPDFYNNQS